MQILTVNIDDLIYGLLEVIGLLENQLSILGGVVFSASSDFVLPCGLNIITIKGKTGLWVRVQHRLIGHT